MLRTWLVICSLTVVLVLVSDGRGGSASATVSQTASQVDVAS